MWNFGTNFENSNFQENFLKIGKNSNWIKVKKILKEDILGKFYLKFDTILNKICEILEQILKILIVKKIFSKLEKTQIEKK